MSSKAIRIIIYISIYIVVYSSTTFAAIGYKIIDLGTANGTDSYGNAINNKGDIVGFFNGAPPNTGQGHAFIWNKDEGMIEIPVYSDSPWLQNPEETFSMVAMALNNLGQVIGYTNYGHNSPGGGWGRDELRPFIWTSQESTRELNTLGGITNNVFDINDIGQIVGSGYAAGYTHALMWTPEGSINDLGTLGGTISSAAAINEFGDVVGSSTISQTNYNRHAFLRTKEDEMLNLGNLGSENTYATDINDFREIVGYSDTSNGMTHAFLWTIDSGIVDISTLGDLSWANAINNKKQIVGYFMDFENELHPYSPFIWENGLMLDLQNMLFTVADWELLWANDINDSGQITGCGRIDLNGNGIYDNGEDRAYLLIPINNLKDVLEFIKELIWSGDLSGSGPGKSADHRLNSFINKIEAASKLLNLNNNKNACKLIELSIMSCDGDNVHEDFVIGEGAPLVADMLSKINISIGCEQ